MFARLLTALGLISALACAALGAPGHQGSSFSPIIFGGIRPVFAENFLTESGLPSANFTSNLTFSRGTLATVTDASGKITYAGNNLVTQSSNINSGSWTKTNATIGGSIVDPYGNTAYAFTASTTSSVALLSNAGGGSVNAGNVISAFVVKPINNGRWLDINFGGNPTSKDAYFDLVNGVTGSKSSGIIATGIRPLTGGFYLIWSVVPVASGSAYSQAANVSSDGAYSWSGAVGDGFYISSISYSSVTYETSPRPQDQVVTGASAYYGPSFDHDSSGAPIGLGIWEARTNVALWNRDLTNAAWTLGATMTSAKNQVGIDGVANSASSLTGGSASATNTILQAITLASSARFQTAYVKRLVGTGIIYMTMDGGSTYVDVTSQIGASYARISIPTQTLANPSIGFKIATNGDSIAVDGVQNENGTFATPVIFTAASAVARAADVLGANTQLAALMAAGPTIVEWTDGATNVTSRALYAAGVFPWSVNKHYRKIAVYRKNTPASYLNAHLVVNGPF